VAEKFGEHFKYVTVDAGMTSAANARVVSEAGKHYLMALKENFHRLYHEAWVALAAAPVKERTRERVKGEWVERESGVVRRPPEEEFPDARQLVWVRQKREREGGVPKVETRLFITSVERDIRSSTRQTGRGNIHPSSKHARCLVRLQP